MDEESGRHLIKTLEPTQERITRRSFVIKGAAATAGVTAGVGALAIGTNLGSAQDSTDGTPAAADNGHAGHGGDTAPAPPAGGPNVSSPFVPVEGEPLRVVETRRSTNGLLETQLEAKLTQTMVAGRDVTTYVYEGSFPGPTLRVNPGETLKVRLINSLDDMTNLHTHGFHVSPEGNSDNIFIHIDPGEYFDYEYNIPENHAPGFYWYHPHAHGNTGMQVNGGMVGGIIINGGLDEIPGIQGLTEHVMLIQATEFDGDGSLVPYGQQTNSSRLRLVNGQYQPTVSIRPGETQRWRIANVSADNFVLLALEGHTLHQIAADGNPYDQVIAMDNILLAPSERCEVLVQASDVPGRYELRTLMWGPSYQAEPDALLATMVIEGDAVEPQPLPTALIPFEDFREVEVDNTRTTVFEEPGPPLYLAIDGKHWDPDRIDQTVKLNAVEEWVIKNESSHWHPFHIHVNDFQVVNFNGEDVHAHSHHDTIPLPPYSETTIRMRFADFTGKFVYHCHILAHEDFGMMANVEVVE